MRIYQHPIAVVTVLYPFPAVVFDPSNPCLIVIRELDPVSVRSQDLLQVSLRVICFDTAIVDLTEELSDPVEVLFGVQLGGGTDINSALAYCEQRIEHPSKTQLILITDLYESGDAKSMLPRVAALKQSGVNIIVLLALSDDGHPGYHANHAEQIAAMDCPVFACTPDQFPELMAAALTRQDISQWAGARDIRLVRGA